MLTSLHTLPAVFSQAAEVSEITIVFFPQHVLINEIVHDQTAALHSYLYKRKRNLKTLGEKIIHATTVTKYSGRTVN